MTSSTPPLTDEVLSSVVGLARAHLAAGQPLGVPDLADHAGYSPFHFSRMFAAKVQITPGQFLISLRMDAAKRMLLNSSEAVIDIATAVGFDSLSSFSRRFSATVGVSPGGLRELADKLAGRPPQPFRLVDGSRPIVRVRPWLPGGEPASDLLLWIGWFAAPAPIGLPASGVLARHGEPVQLPLSPGNPWLLGYAVRADAGVLDQLAPTAPLVAVHGPVRHAGSVRLQFAPADASRPPLLSALPSLCRA